MQSLIVLRPAAALVLGAAIYMATWRQVLAFRFLFGVAGAIIALVVIQLIPLPPGVWSSLPGRDLAVEVGRVVGLGELWRPISLVPAGTWNALYALLVPMAVLLLATGVTREQRFQLLPILIVLGMVSGFLGLMQAIGPSSSGLYLYRVTNHGSAVGLFANRNHQAMLLTCLFPMLAVYAATGARSVEQARLRAWLAAGAGAMLIPLLLVTGSRAGLLLGVVGLVSIPLLYRRPKLDKPAKRRFRKFDVRYVVGGVAACGLALATVLMSRGEAVTRLLSADETTDLRFSIWGPIVQMVAKYFPLGSGFGSFVEIYQIDEPDVLLGPNYLNHAHNDWLELALTGGLPALLLLGIVVVAWVWKTWSILRAPADRGRGEAFERLGAVIIFILALGSAVDYPLRVPSLASLFVVAAVWMMTASGQSSVRRKHSIENNGIA